MADPIRIADGLIWQRPAHAVYVKADWGGEWEQVRGLYCDSVSYAAAPTVPQAKLTWTYGQVMAPGGSGFEIAERLRIDRYYVKVVFQQVGPNPVAPFPGDGSTNYTWHGQVEEVDDQRGGTLVRPIWNDRGTRITGHRQIPTGKQIFGCLGLEMVLKAAPIRRSIVRAADGSTREIQRAITFNDPRIGPSGESVPQPNRSTIKGPKGVYVFADVGASSTFWTTQSILDYLLIYAAPENLLDFEDMLPFRLHSDSGQAWPISVAPSALDRPVLDIDGRSLYEAISTLCDRRRLLGWSIDGVDPINKINGRDVVLLRTWRFNSEAISLHQGTLPPNPRQKTLAGFDQAAGAVRAKVRRSLSETYRRVIARGGRNRAIFTLSHKDGTLTTGWTTALADEYREALSGSAGYDDLDMEQQQKGNQRFRNRDRLGSVFCRFALAQTFNGQVGNGTGGPKQDYFPRAKNTDPLLPHYWPGIRFLRRLPMKPDADSGSLDDDCPLIALFKNSDGKWDYGDRAASTIEFSDHPIGRRWSLICVPAPNNPAVELRVSGAPQHVIALNDFSPLDVDEPGDVDWRDQMLVTVAMEVDQWCEGVFQPTAGDVETAGEIISAFDAIRTLVIELGPIARRDWIVYGTVIGLDNKGELQRQTPGKWLRDDQLVVEDLAKMAGYWYTRPRKACEFSFDGVFGGLEVGDLLNSIGGQLVTRDEDGNAEVVAGETTTLNAAVTQVTWDLAGMKTELTTDYAELDITDLSESLGLKK